MSSGYDDARAQGEAVMKNRATPDTSAFVVPTKCIKDSYSAPFLRFCGRKTFTTAFSAQNFRLCGE